MTLVAWWMTICHTLEMERAWGDAGDEMELGMQWWAAAKQANAGCTRGGLEKKGDGKLLPDCSRLWWGSTWSTASCFGHPASVEMYKLWRRSKEKFLSYTKEWEGLSCNGKRNCLTRNGLEREMGSSCSGNTIRKPEAPWGYTSSKGYKELCSRSVIWREEGRHHCE